MDCILIIHIIRWWAFHGFYTHIHQKTVNGFFPHLFDLLVDHLPGLFVLDALRNLPNPLTIAPQNQVRIDLAPGVSLEITQQKNVFSMGNMVINYEIFSGFSGKYPIFSTKTHVTSGGVPRCFFWTKTPVFSSRPSAAPSVVSRPYWTQRSRWSNVPSTGNRRELKGNGAREASSRFVCKEGIKPQETMSFLCGKYEIMITIKFRGSQFSDKPIFTSRCSECFYSNVYPNIRTTLAYICVAKSCLVSGAIASIVSEILVTLYIINRPS